MSRAIAEAPVSLPSVSRSGESDRLTTTSLPSFRRRTVSRSRTACPARISLEIRPVSAACDGGTTIATWQPMASEGR